MSDRQTASLGDIDPAGSRQRGRRSAVALTDDSVVVGTADGVLRAFDIETMTERWSVFGEASVVTALPFDDCVAVGTRGEAGAVRVHDATTGARRWTYETAAHVGLPAQLTRFMFPFVAGLATDGQRLYVAARRYERSDDDRRFESVVVAFDPDGTCAWTHEVDASPTALDARDDRVAVAYNRCPGDHQYGLVVLDAAAGSVRSLWDPGTDGQRRVGDVSLLPDGAVVASHGDYCGYRLAQNGAERWRVPLGRPVQRGDETLYAYPNHVHATPDGAVFVTGNTFARDKREAEGRHPNEHTAIGISPSGSERWSTPVGGFAHEIAADGQRIAVPAAQHFRDRDAEGHGYTTLDIERGTRDRIGLDGIATAIALGPERLAVVEEPVVYHDEGTERGSYQVHALSN
jgi:outer membrane protein assembly factor BamB